MADATLRIFVCYRREETRYAARALGQAFDKRLPDVELFIDVDRRAIAVGENWRRKIETAIDASDVVIAIIGDKWLEITGADGRRKLDSPDDPVRLELERALKLDLVVIPALLDDVRMPEARELPASISELVFREGAEIRHSRFDDDIKELIESVEHLRPELRQKRLAKEAARAAELEREERKRAEQERLAQAERAAITERAAREEAEKAAEERVAPAEEARLQEDRDAAAQAERDRAESEAAERATRARDELEAEQAREAAARDAYAADRKGLREVSASAAAAVKRRVSWLLRWPTLLLSISAALAVVLLAAWLVASGDSRAPRVDEGRSFVTLGGASEGDIPVVHLRFDEDLRATSLPKTLFSVSVNGGRAQLGDTRATRLSTGAFVLLDLAAGTTIKPRASVRVSYQPQSGVAGIEDEAGNESPAFNVMLLAEWAHPPG